MERLNKARSVALSKSLGAACVEGLNSSREMFRYAQLSANGAPYDKVVVGAAIFRPPSEPSGSKTSEILLLKRSEKEVYYPNVYEIPSGKVDSEDGSILEALVREVFEETNLDVSAVLAELKPMTYSTKKTIEDEDGRQTTVSKTAIQLNYVVRVHPGDMRTNPAEHSEGKWTVESGVHKLNITEAMKMVVQEAFAWEAHR